jgi:hypothetical protein
LGWGDAAGQPGSGRACRRAIALVITSIQGQWWPSRR